MAATITLSQLLTNIKTNIINPLLLVMFAWALVVFVYGLAETIRKAGSPGDRATGQKHMLWGLVGLVIMLSALGIANLICATIGCE